MGTRSVSIIIPAFNDQLGLDNCLLALAQQTWPADAVEVIVVDNGSTPPLQLPPAQLDTVRLIRCLTPGSYAARNAGAAEATGDILAFTDADCRPESDWLRNGIAALLNGDGERIIGGEVLFDAIKSPSAVALYQIVTGFGQASNVRDKGFSATANLFCMRRHFKAVGPFDTRLLSGGDREWCWRASRHGLSLHFEASAVIHTAPRSNLRSAIRQARRVVGGRKMLRELGLTHTGEHAVKKLRSPWQSFIWILQRHELGVADRLRVLAVASLIKVAAILESFRLALGSKPERR